MNKVEPKSIPIPTSVYLENVFQAYHGRMVKLLSPLPKGGVCWEVAKRIGLLIAAVIMYPAWGCKRLVSSLVNKCITLQHGKDVKNELIEKICKNLSDWPLEIQDGKLLLFGYSIKNGKEETRVACQFPVNNKEEYKNAVNEIQKMLKQMDEYTENFKIDFEVLAVGNLKQNNENNQYVEYQPIKLSYKGIKADGGLGMSDQNLKDVFLNKSKKTSKSFFCLQIYGTIKVNLEQIFIAIFDGICILMHQANGLDFKSLGYRPGNSVHRHCWLKACI